MRYGSCVYYACYPQYLALVNATGGRVFRDPLKQFEPFAQCELDAAEAYYKAVAATPCLRIRQLGNWRCATAAGPLSLSVGNTIAVISVVFTSLFVLFVGHVFYFRGGRNPLLEGAKK